MADVIGSLEFPFKSHYAELDGRRIHFVDEGFGLPVLLLHGNPTWSFLYRRMIPPLVAAGYRCIAPDLLGFGLSEKPIDESAYSLKTHVRLITLLIEKLKLRGIVIAGHDWGVPILLKYAIEHRRNTRGAIILNTAVRTRAVPLWYQALFRAGALSSFLVRRLDLFRRLVFGFGFYRDPGKSVLRQYKVPHPTAASRAGIAAFPKMLPELSEIDEALAHWDLPLLVLWSKRDRLLRAEEGCRIAERVPLSNFHLVKNACHFLQEDAPEEVVADIITFLQDRVERAEPATMLIHEIMESTRDMRLHRRRVATGK